MNKVTKFYGVYGKYFDTEVEAIAHKKEVDLTRAVNTYISNQFSEGFDHNDIDARHIKEFLQGLVGLIPDGYLKAE